LTPSRKALENYTRSLQEFAKLGVVRETAVCSPFQTLLDDCARQVGWKLIPEYPLQRRGRVPLRADGALVDEFNLPHGFWEAKKGTDDLDKEIKAKFALGYPQWNILFQSPDRAVLYQNGNRVLDTPLTKSEHLVDVLRAFLTYEEPSLDEWEKATGEFKDRIAEHGRALTEIIRKEENQNPKFKATFDAFADLCRASLNPTLSVAAVEEMLVQHILTERIFRKIFAVGDFMQRNVIAVEIEKVVQALTARAFSREDFLKTLDRFYVAIEDAAATIKDFSEKQKFLNTVYERFFQGFAVKQADTLGIIYTPQPIVDFMVASVERVLERDFKKSLAHKQVHILDGFTGTGNFIANIMQAIPRANLPHKYAEELHCNEVLLLPYYVASMNIEHAFWEATGEYKPFEGICLVDTFSIAEEHTGSGVQAGFEFMSKANTERIRRQRSTPIFVCIGNPPYNAGQINENDNNKNRKYPELDARVSKTYGDASRATLLRKLADPYVKAIRWATDRIGDAGIVAFVNNDSFIDEISFDGMRHHLARDFDLIYVLDLGGNVRKNPKLSGTTHNVFGIQVGVSINFFIRLPMKTKNKPRAAKIFYHSVPGDWRREQKYDFLERTCDFSNVKWQELKPDAKDTWLTSNTDTEFAAFTPIGSKEAKANVGTNLAVIFQSYSLGVSTNRDRIVYNFDTQRLAKRVEEFCDDYNAELHRWQQKGCPTDIDDFLSTEKVKWSETLKRRLSSAVEASFAREKIRAALYRPFVSKLLFVDELLIDRPAGSPGYFPDEIAENENRVICVSDVGLRSNFSVLVTNRPFDLHLCASTDAFQGFPFYIFDEDGRNRRENIPLKTLIRFQSQYGDDRITKWDIFHYAYALLHHPGYRERFGTNLKRELPRIPFAPDFRVFAKAGKKLAELHINYEQAHEFPLKRIENRDVPLNWRVAEMKLTPDHGAIHYNEFLTLEGIPAEVFDYKLGNRSALEWVIEQYQVSTDHHGSVENDPNRPDDEQYIVRLIGQVITVSLETLKIVKSLPADFGAEGEQSKNDKELEEWRLMQPWRPSRPAQQIKEVREQVRSRSKNVLTANETSSSYGPEKKD
jgi:predicted helicase